MSGVSAARRRRMRSISPVTVARSLDLSRTVLDEHTLWLGRVLYLCALTAARSGVDPDEVMTVVRGERP